jgi:hypothetical protein
MMHQKEPYFQKKIKNQKEPYHFFEHQTVSCASATVKTHLVKLKFSSETQNRKYAYFHHQYLHITIIR